MGDEARAELAIINPRGLHARAAARFVKLAESFDAEITVERDGQKVGGTSILGLMMLGAGPGAKLTLTCRGPQAAEALAALSGLVEGGFDEMPS
ncbi:MAG: HPr family phosphocarrier protein [Geminicoccaceae bacterium]